MAELEIFEKDIEKCEVQPADEEEITEHNFNVGDKVEIRKGDLNNLQGKIVSIEKDEIAVLPYHSELTEILPFRAHELSKIFVVGDSVKVIYNNKYDIVGYFQMV